MKLKIGSFLSVVMMTACNSNNPGLMTGITFVGTIDEVEYDAEGEEAELSEPFVETNPVYSPYDDDGNIPEGTPLPQFEITGFDLAQYYAGARTTSLILGRSETPTLAFPIEVESYRLDGNKIVATAKMLVPETQVGVVENGALVGMEGTTFSFESFTFQHSCANDFRTCGQGFNVTPPTTESARAAFGLNECSDELLDSIMKPGDMIAEEGSSLELGSGGLKLSCQQSDDHSGYWCGEDFEFTDSDGCQWEGNIIATPDFRISAINAHIVSGCDLAESTSPNEKYCSSGNGPLVRPEI